MNQEKIGKFIATLRKEKNMTQEELAEKLGVNNRTISRWENGNNMPDYSIVKDLCNILGISVNELINGERIKKDKLVEEYDDNLVNVLIEYKKMKEQKTILLIILCYVAAMFIQSFLLLGFVYFSYTTSKEEVNTDISKYNNYIGENAKEIYRNKWDMNEEIFPNNISDNMNVKDYKMVYYNPWDAQYLSYLVVEYEEEDYIKEVKRLKDYESTEYLGYYGVTGFSKYTLLAIEADPYQGFVYAITDGKSKIIYVEIIFCNYFMDIDYNNYIDEDFLPDGFDATLENEYRKMKIN